MNTSLVYSHEIYDEEVLSNIFVVLLELVLSPSWCYQRRCGCLLVQCQEIPMSQM
jgi:hypothetical protein